MMKKEKNYLIELNGRQYYCPVEVGMDVIGGKWKMVILWYLQGQTLRFSELKKAIVTISEKMLIRELRELEQAGIVNRKVYPEVPPKVEYCISEWGETLLPLLGGISQFGEAYAKRFGQITEEPASR